MQRSFEFYNVTFKRSETGAWLVIKGEIRNNSGRSYATVVFAVIVFVRNIPIGSCKILISGFAPAQSRPFEKQVGDLEYDRVFNDITHYEIFPESAY
jgi:hypothetical protein